jgi:hypothetical protein
MKILLIQLTDVVDSLINSYLIQVLPIALNSYKQNGYRIIGLSAPADLASGHIVLPDAIAREQFLFKVYPEIKEIYLSPDFQGIFCWRITLDQVEPMHSTGLSRTLRLIGKYHPNRYGMPRIAVERACRDKQQSNLNPQTLFVCQERQWADNARQAWLSVDEFLSPWLKGVG